MISQKTLKLYVYTDGVNDIPLFDEGLYQDFVTIEGNKFVTVDGFSLNVSGLEIGSFRYDAKRMGGAPSITCTIMHETCLDDFWSDKVYTLFKGERYFLKQTPTSSKTSDDSRYKHELELISERFVLENAYFYDAVTGDPLENDKPVTNDTKFNFYGSIEDYVRRMNASLQYTGIQKVIDGEVIGYHVVIDEDVVSQEEKLVSFDGAVFTQALQESYNTFGIPFYFKGKEIHIGYTDNVINDTIEYGVDNALLSITKNNANFKVVNRATGKGSEENIPYYYPNNSPKGDIEAVPSREGLGVVISDEEKFSSEVSIGGKIKFLGYAYNIGDTTYKQDNGNIVTYPYDTIINSSSEEISFTTIVHSEGKNILHYDPAFTLERVIEEGKGWDEGEGPIYFDLSQIHTRREIELIYGKNSVVWRKDLYLEDEPCDIEIPFAGDFRIVTTLYWRHRFTPNYKNGKFYLFIKFNATIEAQDGWYYDDKRVELENIGLSLEEGVTLEVGDTITQSLAKYVNVSDNLQPSIYRATDGKERFYNAKNYPFEATQGYELQYGEYIKKGLVHNDAYKYFEAGEEKYYHFANEYTEVNPKEHVFTVDDIKPTIQETTNSVSWVDDEGNRVYQRIDMFSEFAYDKDDNDETYIDEDGSTNFKHPYFFAKLRKLPFNLFEHASENGPMTISFTSGHCGACSFEIGVSDDERYINLNPVQIYEEDTTDKNGEFHPKGSLVYDEDGRVLCGLEDYQGPVQPYEEQQDTINYEVWIALKKEDSTYGILMPKAPKYDKDELGNIKKDDEGKPIVIEAGHRPIACSDKHANDGDTFVITNITLPDEYIHFAEDKLEKAIVKYIWENNKEKFNFSVGFSRIFLEENQSFYELLDENARMNVRYDGKDYLLYVSSYSYQMSAGEVLPNITVELDDTLTISQNVIQNAINEVKSDIATAINAIDVAAIGSKYFLRKDVDDVSQGVVDFRRGIIFADGGEVEVYKDGSAKLTIDYLEVTKKATFTSLEVQEKVHAGGQILLTPAAMTCSDLDEVRDENGNLIAWRCYLQTKGGNGEEVFNTFAQGDQAICQTFNEWGNKYYWRLVASVGEDYIDLSVEDCDDNSDAPSIGDKIIQLGNRENEERQNAIVLAAHGDNSPYIIQYKGINDFDLGDDKIVTKLSSTENIFTGKVHMELGSDGLENIDGGLNIGGQNLLRNSGFTGSYLSEPLTDEIVMDATKELYSDPLDFWFSEEHPVDNASVVDSDVSSSGKLLVINNGSVTQELYQHVIKDESYVLSFKAKGGSLTYNVGGISKEVVLTNSFVRYVEKISTLESGNIFAITNATCEICDIQLERGTIATAWGVSPYDNSSDRAYYQSMRYIADSVVNEAMTEGATDLLGGLILTNHIKVGEYANKTMVKETGGVSGKYDSQNSVAFWAGGEFDKALTTANKYKGTATTTPEGEAPFVVTHGGKAVMNDAIVRGTVYAKDGEFNGKVQATSGVFNDVEIQSGKIADFDISGGHLGIQEELGGDGMFLYNRYIGFRKSEDGYKRESIIGDNVIPSSSGFTGLAKYENTTTDYHESLGGVGIGVISNVSGYKDSYAFASEKGVFAGFRPHTTVLGSSNNTINLGKYHHTILAIASGSIYLDTTPENGQEYEIICPNLSSITVEVKGGASKNLYLMHDGVTRTGFSIKDLNTSNSAFVIKMVYFSATNQWYVWYYSYK